MAQLKKTINDFIHESIARFITGDMDLDKDWENYIKSLNDMGLQRYIELNQKAYDLVYKRK